MAEGPKVGGNAVNQTLEKSRKRKGGWQGKCWARNLCGQCTSLKGAGSRKRSLPGGSGPDWLTEAGTRPRLWFPTGLFWPQINKGSFSHPWHHWPTCYILDHCSHWPEALPHPLSLGSFCSFSPPLPHPGLVPVSAVLAWWLRLL